MSEAVRPRWNFLDWLSLSTGASPRPRPHRFDADAWDRPGRFRIDIRSGLWVTAFWAGVIGLALTIGVVSPDTRSLAILVPAFTVASLRLVFGAVFGGAVEIDVPRGQLTWRRPFGRVARTWPTSQIETVDLVNAPSGLWLWDGLREFLWDMISEAWKKSHAGNVFTFFVVRIERTAY